jgi:UDP-glucuronate decarboxylase
MSPHHVLIAGGAGFLGSHLCDRYIELGCHVICVDDLSTGRLDNIQHLLGHPNFTYRQHDIQEPLEARADLVINMACPASPPRYQEDPIRTMFVNVLGTKNLLDVAVANDAAFLQSSTSEVYGQPEVHPQPETYHGRVNTLGPRACYDEGKRAAEALCMDYGRVHGTKVRIARIFNTYGPRMAADDGRVVSNFVNMALAGDELTIYGAGDQTRSFCYVDDLVDGLMRLAASDVTTPVNLGSTFEMTILELAERLRDMVGNVELAFLPRPKDDPMVRRPDISRARELLGWHPKVSVDDGLRQTIDWFRSEAEFARKAG